MAVWVYSDEIKSKAVELVLDRGLWDVHVAKATGIPRVTIKQWVNQARKARAATADQGDCRASDRLSTG